MNSKVLSLIVGEKKFNYKVQNASRCCAKNSQT